MNKLKNMRMTERKFIHERSNSIEGSVECSLLFTRNDGKIAYERTVTAETEDRRKYCRLIDDRLIDIAGKSISQFSQ